MLKQSSIGQNAQSIGGRLMNGIPLSPDHITLLALVFAFGGFFALAMRQLWLGWALFALASICDMADGAVARLRNQVSARGAFLDGITDRLVEFLLLFGLMLYPLWPTLIAPAWMWLVALLFFGSCLTAFVPAYAYYRGVRPTHEREGLLPRPERMALFLLLILLLALNLTYFASMLLVIGVLLSIGTAVERILYFYLWKE